MVDDLDYLTMDSLLRSGTVPNFKRYIANEAVEFKQSFVTNALCCPSRATFFSGQYTHNHKTYSTDTPSEWRGTRGSASPTA
jgi:N-acetylglucosamine-6-sulfatase